MKVLLWATLMVCAMSVAHCQQGNTNATPPQGDGTANGDSSGNSNNNTFDKNRIAINGIGAFFTQLNNDLLYLRNFIMSNVAEVSQTCGCDRNVLLPFFPPGPAGGVPPGTQGGVPVGAQAAVNNAANPNPRAAPPRAG